MAGLVACGGGSHAHWKSFVMPRRNVVPGRHISSPAGCARYRGEAGVRRCGGFHRDGLFVFAVASGGGFWIMLWWLLPVQPIRWWQVGSWTFLWLVVVQPCLEEIAFRGFVQGWLIPVGPYAQEVARVDGSQRRDRATVRGRPFGEPSQSSGRRGWSSRRWYSASSGTATQVSGRGCSCTHSTMRATLQ